MPQVNESKEVVYGRAEIIEILTAHAQDNHGARELNLKHSVVRVGYSDPDEDGFGYRQPDTVESIHLTFVPEQVSKKR